MSALSSRTDNIHREKMEDGHNTAGPLDQHPPPEPKTPGAPANPAKLPAPCPMENPAPPPTRRFLDATVLSSAGHGDRSFPAASGSVEPFRSRGFLSTQHPSPAQYALSNLVDGPRGREPSGRSPGPDVAPSLVLTPTYCSDCKKMFATIEAFTRHEPMHSLSVKLFPCVECGKYYRHNTALVIHRRTHTGEKPYGCAECGRRFNARSSLVTHGKTHAGKAAYKCPECGKSFARTDDLFHHRRTHSRERRFACDDCGKCFKAEPELAAHRKAHPAGVLFLCSGCGRDFTPYSKLLRHQKSHPQPPPPPVLGERMLADQRA